MVSRSFCWVRNWPSLSASIPSNSSSGLIAGALSSFTGVRTGTAEGIERPAGRNDSTGRAGWFSDRARAAARASGDAGATMAPGMGAFFPVGTFASLTGAAGGGGGATSATTGVGSAGPGATAATAFAFDALVAFTGSAATAAAGSAFSGGAFAGALALTGAVFAGAGLAAAFAGADTALVETGLAAAFAGTGLAGADAALVETGMAAAFAGTGLAGADAALAGAACTGTVFDGAVAGAALAVDTFGDCLAFALAGGATAFAETLGFAVGFVVPLGVVGDFILVGDADRVGGGAGFALVTLAEARFTGTAGFEGADFDVLVTGLPCVIFEAVDFFGADDFFGAGGIFEAVDFFVAVALRAFAAARAAFGLVLVTAALPAVGLDGVSAFLPSFEPNGLPALALDDFPGLDDGPPALAAGLAVGLATTLFGAGAAFFATADFAALRAGIDFDVAATMYSRYGARGTARSPGRRVRLLRQSPEFAPLPTRTSFSDMTHVTTPQPLPTGTSFSDMTSVSVLRRFPPPLGRPSGRNAHSESAEAIDSVFASVDVDANESGTTVVGPAPSSPSSSRSSRAR